MFVAHTGHFAIRMEPYHPHISCERHENPPLTSCEAAAQDMPIGGVRELFGVARDTRMLTVPLPWTKTSPDGKCTITVDNSGPATEASWTDIWTAATAVNAKCVRAAGKGGKITKLGESGKLSVRISNGPVLPILGLPGAQNSTGNSSAATA